MKRKKISANKNKTRSAKIQQSFHKFKKVVDSKLGRIDWKKIGFYAVALLLFVATRGLLGLEAKIIAHQIIKFTAYA